MLAGAKQVEIIPTTSRSELLYRPIKEIANVTFQGHNLDLQKRLRNSLFKIAYNFVYIISFYYAYLWEILNMVTIILTFPLPPSPPSPSLIIE